MRRHFKIIKNVWTLKSAVLRIYKDWWHQNWKKNISVYRYTFKSNTGKVDFRISLAAPILERRWIYIFLHFFFLFSPTRRYKRDFEDKDRCWHKWKKKCGVSYGKKLLTEDLNFYFYITFAQMKELVIILRKVISRKLIIISESAQNISTNFCPLH